EEEAEDEDKDENEEGEEIGHEADTETQSNNRKRSWVWRHFIFVNPMDKARCKYCKKLIACKKGSTSGLSGHLKINRIIKNKEKRQATLYKESRMNLQIFNSNYISNS